jgi:hypothetical protein
VDELWLQSSREGTEPSKSGSFKDEQECFEDLDQRRTGRPVTRTWSTDFLLREGSSREEIGKWLKNKSIPWEKVAPGSDGHIPLWTADAEVWIQENGGVHAMSEGA